jgi:hypothetical protein
VTAATVFDHAHEVVAAVVSRRVLDFLDTVG